MTAHVDQLERLLDQLEGALCDCFRLTDEGDDRSVGFGAGVDVEKPDAGHGGRGLSDGIVNFGPAALGNVGNTFDDLHLVPPEG